MGKEYLIHDPFEVAIQFQKVLSIQELYSYEFSNFVQDQFGQIWGQLQVHVVYVKVEAGGVQEYSTGLLGLDYHFGVELRVLEGEADIKFIKFYNFVRILFEKSSKNVVSMILVNVHYIKLFIRITLTLKCPSFDQILFYFLLTALFHCSIDLKIIINQLKQTFLILPIDIFQSCIKIVLLKCFYFTHYCHLHWDFIIRENPRVQGVLLEDWHLVFSI